MKLCKIYSNCPFHNVEFSSGMNVIIGEISDRNDNEKDTHNLGKSLLLEVIDFLLLKTINNKNKYFLTKNPIFSSYIFFAEIELNSGDFLIVKRAVLNNTKISFRVSSEKLTKFDTSVSNWNESDVPLGKAIDLLNKYLGFDVLPDWKYRKSLNYFMRHQQDYVDVFKLSKFQGPHKDWKPMVFDLLGFDGGLIKQKLELEEQSSELEKKIVLLETENKVSSNEEDKIRGIIELKKDEFEEVSTQIDRFNFYQEDSKQKQYLVDEIDNRIQTNNAKHYAIKHEIAKIQQSLSIDVEVDSIDLQELEELYSEVKVFFPQELLVEYEKVIQFNKSITSERNIFLKENLVDLQKQSTTLDSLLKEMEEEKGAILAELTDMDSYEKFKKYQKNLSKIEAEIFIFEEKLDNINRMSEMQNTLSELSSQIKEKTVELKNALVEQKHRNLRKLFNEFTMDVLGSPAILSVRPNKENNIEFEAEYQNKEDLESTDLGSGNTYKKILCAAFDVSLLQHYRPNSFYRFVFHDGVLDSLDVRKKEKYINFVRKLTAEFKVQYIMTAIESEVDHLQETYELSDDEICLKLSDESCMTKLFKQCF